MAHIVNKDYTEIAADCTSYLTWTMDFKIMPPAHVSDRTKYATPHFMRHHLHLDLKNDGKGSLQTLGCTQRIL